MSDPASFLPPNPDDLYRKPAVSAFRQRHAGEPLRRAPRWEAVFGVGVVVAALIAIVLLVQGLQG